jgi:hypothetical protein
LRNTLSAMTKHPKAALLVEEAYKVVDPNAPTPQLDAQRMVSDAVSKTQSEVEALKKQIADDKAAAEQASRMSAFENKVEQGFAKLRQAGVTKEGIEGVRKIMEDEGIANPEIAWSHFEKLHPPQAPVMASTGSWNFLEAPADDANADLKRLVETKGESNSIIDKLAFEALNEVRGLRR